MRRDTMLPPAVNFKIGPDPRQAVPLDVALDLFLTAKQIKVSGRTLEAYQWALAKFADWLRAHDLADLAALTAHHVRLYLVGLQAGGLTPWTIHDHMRPVKTFLRFLYREELLPSDLMAKVDMPRAGNDVLPPYDPAEVHDLLAACLTPRDTALILFLLDTGVRSSELCALTLADVDMRSGAVIVREGKGGKQRTVFLGARARKALLKYLMPRRADGPDAPVFPNTVTGEPLLRNGLQLWCRRIGKRAGVAQCHPHRFRRTFALWSLRAGMDVFSLQRLMGHADLKVLRGYLAQVEDDLRIAHRDHGAVDRML